MPPGSVPSGGSFPLSWLLDLPQKLSSGDTAAAFAGLPVQQRGKGGERGHYAGGNGHPQQLKQAPKRPEWTVPARAGEHSFDPATSKRLTDKSTGASDLYQNADGSLTLRQGAGGRVNFKGTDGKYRPIDLTLVPATGDRLKVSASDLGISFAAPRATGAGGGYVGVRQAATPTPTDLAAITLPTGELAGYRLLGAAAVTPTVVGNQASYADILPHVDIELVATESGIKENLVLKSAAAGHSFVFPLHLNGLTPHLADDGSVELRNSAGEMALHIPRAFMEDSAPVDESGERPKNENVTYELTTVEGVPALRVTADAAWLNDPARVWPVRLDPTMTTGDMADAFVDDDPNTGSSTQNGTSLAVGRHLKNGSPAYKARSFMAFDNFAGQGLVGTQITAAKLWLFLTWTSDCSTHLPFYVHRVSGSWSAAGLATAGLPGPAYGSSIGSLTVADNYPACTNTGDDRTKGKWVTVTLNPWTFHDWATANGTGNWNNGLAMTAAEDTGYSWKRFTSANHAAYTCVDRSCRPYLELTYAQNTAPQINSLYPQSGTSATSLTPVLVANAHDPDGFPSSLQYRFEVFDDKEMKPESQVRIADSNWITQKTWQVPAGILKWGGRYRWQVTVHDGVSNNGLASYTWQPDWRYLLTTPVPQTVITSRLGSNGDTGFAAGSGTYTSDATDAQVETVGPALAIQRSYNSLDPRIAGAFGAGWSSLLDSRAIENLDTTGNLATVSVMYSSGQETAFGHDGGGKFSPGAGKHSTFSTVDTGGYSLVDKAGTKYLTRKCE